MIHGAGSRPRIIVWTINNNSTQTRKPTKIHRKSQNFTEICDFKRSVLCSLFFFWHIVISRRNFRLLLFNINRSTGRVSGLDPASQTQCPARRRAPLHAPNFPIILPSECFDLKGETSFFELSYRSKALIWKIRPFFNGSRAELYITLVAPFQNRHFVLFPDPLYPWTFTILGSRELRSGYSNHAANSLQTTSGW